MVHTKVGAFDAERGRAAAAFFSFFHAADLVGDGGCEADGFGNAHKGEVAGDVVGVVAVFCDGSALEGERGVLFNVEKLVGFEVSVALIVVGVDAGCLDSDLDAAGFRVLGIEGAASSKISE